MNSYRALAVFNLFLGSIAFLGWCAGALVGDAPSPIAPVGLLLISIAAGVLSRGEGR